MIETVKYIWEEFKVKPLRMLTLLVVLGLSYLCYRDMVKIERLEQDGKAKDNMILQLTASDARQKAILEIKDDLTNKISK